MALKFCVLCGREGHNSSKCPWLRQGPSKTAPSGPPSKGQCNSKPVFVRTGQ